MQKTKKQIKRNLIYFLALSIPLLFVFKILFTKSTLVWGDAPFFTHEGLKELVKEPYIWTSRNQSFGGVNLLLWLYPIMFIYGFLHKLFSFSNSELLKIIFYFPSIILSVLTSSMLAKFLKFKRVGIFFTSLFYSLNTYFILLIDGGQVGVALAYSIFPLSILSLKLLSESFKRKSFLLAVISSLLITLIDFRISLISFLMVSLWIFIENYKNFKLLSKKIIALFLVFLICISINLYWIFPLLRIENTNLSTSVTDLKFTSLLNSLLLYQPHWPINQFGKITPPPFYFILLPIIIFLPLTFKKDSKYLNFVFLFLIFAFLTKGATNPLGIIYEKLVKTSSIGIVFRDSSKFFIPLFLLASLVIGKNLQTKSSKIIIVIIYFYLIFTVHDALTGNIKGVLTEKSIPKDIQIINDNLKSEKNFARTLWFPKISNYAFQSQKSEAISAVDLINLRPFSYQNTGTDVFNFIYKSSYQSWFELLGIKYIILDHWANIQPIEEEIKNNKNLELVNWNTNLEIFKTKNPFPEIFSSKKIIAVIGNDDVATPKNPFIFFEDGKLDPLSLKDVDKESVLLIYNHSNQDDLTMSFLQKFFISPTNFSSSNWSTYSTEDYLKWKYELLINNFKFKDFDYSKGIAFSTNQNEKINFKFNNKNNQNFYLAVRSLQTGTEEIKFNSESWQIGSNTEHLKWFIKGPIKINDTNNLSIINKNGISVLNTVSLIPEEDYQKAKQYANDYINTFSILNLNDQSDEKQFLNLLNENGFKDVEFQKMNPVSYKINSDAGNQWIILSYNFNPNWALFNGSDFISPVPVYSMINGFYMKKGRTKGDIIFKPQDDLRTGVYFSLIAITSLVIIFLISYPNNK